MRARLQYLRFLSTSSLWLVPGLMILGAVVVARATLALDEGLEMAWLQEVPWLRRIGPEGARQFLATVATSMITVVSLVFSMTLVALTLASTQLGPRVLTLFMSDRINQLVLGTFVATFLYALMVLQTVTEGGQGGASFVPHLSLVVALILTATNLGWLVYFIHHVANSIQADYVIAEVSDQLHRALGERFPQVDPRRGKAAQAALLDPLTQPAGAVFPSKAGYVQVIDATSLHEAATHHDLVIKVEHRPGNFVITGTAILQVWPQARLSPELAKDLREAVVIGRKRTPAQDIEFALGELEDIALRAMSPGINDPRTALACVDRLGEALAEVMRHEAPVSLIEDRDGILRLIVSPVSFEGALDAAFNQIRQFAHGYFWVLVRLVEILTTLARFIRDGEQRSALGKHAEILGRACRTATADEADREAAEQRLAELDRWLREPESERRERPMVTA